MIVAIVSAATIVVSAIVVAVVVASIVVIIHRHRHRHRRHYHHRHLRLVIFIVAVVSVIVVSELSASPLFPLSFPLRLPQAAMMTTTLSSLSSSHHTDDLRRTSVVIDCHCRRRHCPIPHPGSPHCQRNDRRSRRHQQSHCRCPLWHCCCCLGGGGRAIAVWKDSGFGEGHVLSVWYIFYLFLPYLWL